MGTTFHWALGGLNKARFDAYAKLLSLRNGGQVEDLSEMDDIIDDPSAIPNDDESVRANPADSGATATKLKRAFLDRLSELMANAKGGYHVSASLMIEWPDHVDVLVARNNGIKLGDPAVQVLETISTVLQQVARLGSAGSSSTPAQELWESLVEWYRPRLVDYLIRAKTAVIKANYEDARLGQISTPLRDMFRGLYDTLDIVSRSPTKEALTTTIVLAHDLVRDFDEAAFQAAVWNKAHAQSMRSALGFLGRIYTCFNTFIRAAERLSNFSGLQIIPVTVKSGKAQNGVPETKWSAVQAFSSLNLRLDDQTATRVMVPSPEDGKAHSAWTKGKLLQKFDKLKSPGAEVHAEVQVVLSLAQRPHTGATVLGYVGCSKRSCFLCAEFLKAFGSFSTRGCHGKVYNLWGVPQDLSVPTDSIAGDIASAVASAEQAMKRLLLRKKKGRAIPQVAESSVGGSSVATTIPQFVDAHLARLVMRHLQSEREDVRRSVADKNKDKDHIGDNEGNGADILQIVGNNNSPVAPHTDGDPAESTGVCDTCDLIETSRRCSYCNRDWFCSQVCQDRMSWYHLTGCSARSITTADRLFHDVIGDRIPEDPDTRHDFGFTRCRTWQEESHLLGMLRGMALSDRIHASDFHEWRVKGILVEKIVEFYTSIPEQNRGGYFPWFARNKHILDPLTPPLDMAGKDNPLLRAIEEARPYLDPQDRAKELHELQPPAKSNAFLFFAMALVSSRPHPAWDGFDLWYEFGFPTCPSDFDESQLGALYTVLIAGNKFLDDYDKSLGIRPSQARPRQTRPLCPFSEFWRAYERRELPALFEKYGLPSALDGIHQHTKGFLSNPSPPSVWRVKHMLALGDNVALTGFPAVEAAAQEYGFKRNLDARTKIELLRFYKELFEKGDPIRIHLAKQGGRLLEYAGDCGLQDIDKCVKRVLGGLL